MRIRHEDRFVQSSGLKTVNAFQISASSHMFRVLSDGLYSDKVTAVIRELTCNARDAHTAAGKEHVPYKVHLPTILEPEFYVRDYGIGLCYDDILNLYTTYGESLKNTTNDMIGGLGLGSKSPFAYTDQFTIEGRYGGELMMFSCYVDEKGEPQIAHLTTMPDDEGNGLTIRMPVASKDFGEFITKATALFEYYEPMPDVNVTLDMPYKEVVLEDAGLWRIWQAPQPTGGYSYNYRSYNTKVMALQGQVQYPIVAERLTSIPEHLKNMLSGVNMDIWFSIGELEVAANREDLSYTPHTLQSIEDRLTVVYDALLIKAEAEIKDADNLWDASIKAAEIEKIFKNNHRLSQSIIKGMKYRGKPVHHTTIRLDGKEMDALSKCHMKYIPKASSQNKALKFRDLQRHGEGWKIAELKYIKLFYSDQVKPIQVPSTIQYSLGADEYKLVLIEGSEGEFKKLLDYLGNPAYTRLSTMTQPPTATRGVGGGKISVKEWTSSSYRRWCAVTHDLTVGGVYVKLFAGEIQTKTHSFGDAELANKIRYLRDILGDNTTIHGIPSTFHSRLDKNLTVWKSFEQHYEDCVKVERKKLSNHTEIQRYVTLHRLYSKGGDTDVGNFIALFKDKTYIFKYQILNKVMKDYKEYLLLDKKYNKKRESIEKLFSGKEDEAYMKSTKDKLKEVWSKHPLIHYGLSQYRSLVNYKDEIEKLLT